MKKLTLSLCALVALGSAALAGTETYSKESKAVVPPPCPQWYADNEFNLSLWGTYAPTGNDWRNDTYLVADHAWGGGIDAKYFVHRYFGFGVEGFFLNPNSHETLNDVVIGHDNRIVGSVMGTFTLRFPISCSRFAPYFWLGGGGIFGGGQDRETFIAPVVGGSVALFDHRFPVEKTKSIGQIGGGFEVRFTPHIGLQNDFSWNVVSGSDNNFGMARTGINFAF